MEAKKDSVKGMSIFLDVFRRADKNDDSALSWDEFRSFFVDGVFSETELKNLFHDIDTHNTNNIDTDELCTYFSKHLGPFKDIFCALEDMNLAVSNALSASAQDYPKASTVEQFTTRFLLREITNQLSALASPLDAAGDALDEETLEGSSPGDTKTGQSAASVIEWSSRQRELEVNSENCDKVALASITPGRVARRAKKQFSTQTSWTSEAGISGGAGAITQQVDRLRGLVDRLENKVNFGNVPEEEVIELDKEELIVVVSRRMHIEENHEKAFKNSLRNYVESVSKLDECLSVSVRAIASSPLVAVYEVWGSYEDWQDFTASETSKNFRRSNIDHLATPEQNNFIKLPSNWWPSSE